MQNIDRNIFPGLNALENSTEEKYLLSFVLREIIFLDTNIMHNALTGQ